jgi:hypothetical protein
MRNNTLYLIKIVEKALFEDLYLIL